MKNQAKGWSGVAAIAVVCGVLSLANAKTPSGKAGEWPQWRGPNRDAVSRETGLLRSWTAAPPLAMKLTGAGTGFSSVAIAGGRLFTMGDIGADQFVIAMSLADGKTLWKTRIGPAWDDQFAGPRGTPTVDGDSL